MDKPLRSNFSFYPHFWNSFDPFLQAEDVFAPPNTFPEFMGLHSSEPIARSTSFGYGQAPQVPSHFILVFKTALTHFLQAEGVFAPPDTFLDFQDMRLPAFNNIISADEWKVCTSRLLDISSSHTVFLGVWKAFVREAAYQKIALLYHCWLSDVENSL
jgi:hypothetical protein